MRDEGEFEGVFAAMAKARADARILIVSRLTSGYRIELTKLGREVEASDDVLEAVHGTGGLPLSYGADRNAMFHRAATFVHKILKGEKPADLPITGVWRKLRLLPHWLVSYPGLIWRYLRAPAHDAVIVGYMGHLDVLVLWPLARSRRDPMSASNGRLI